MGLSCGIPAWLVAGVWWGSFIGRRIHIEVPDELVVLEPGSPAVPTARLPTVPAVRVAPAVPGAPAARVAPARVVPGRPRCRAPGRHPGADQLHRAGADGADPGRHGGHDRPARRSAFRSVLLFVGTPAIALTIAVLVAMYCWASAAA